jgi:hypothetical protein
MKTNYFKNGRKIVGKILYFGDKPNYKTKKDCRLGTKTILPIPSQKTGTMDRH